MAQTWDEARVQQYIDDGIEESLNLDYKAADAISKTDGKKREITKDVSAMANSDGGVLIYGLIEQNHLPGSIDPVKRSDFSKEWLEHVIGNIRPRIDNLLIHPISIGGSTVDTVYIVEIPQSYTAHQAMDKRYYKRHNFESVAMDDYEIRDVMNRRQHPAIDLELEAVHTHFVREQDWLLRDTSEISKSVGDVCMLNVWARNCGNVYANYVNAFVDIPAGMIEGFELADDDHFTLHGDDYRRYSAENKLRGVEDISVLVDSVIVPRSTQGQYQPILPELRMLLTSVKLLPDYHYYNCHHTVAWEVFADSALPKSGSMNVGELAVRHECEKIR